MASHETARPGGRPGIATHQPPRSARWGRARRAAEVAADPLRGRSTRDLVSEVAKTASALARKEVELAKVEVKADLRQEARMAGGLGVAGLCAIWTIALMLVAVVLALQQAGLPGWASALIVAAVVLLVGTAAGLWGWAKRVRRPLETTRRSVEENVRWARERIA